MSVRKLKITNMLTLLLAAALSSCSLFSRALEPGSSGAEEDSIPQQSSSLPAGAEAGVIQEDYEESEGEFAQAVDIEQDSAAVTGMEEEIGSAVNTKSVIFPPPLVPPNNEPYPDNYFENYGVNPFIDTEDDHLSTFSLDVDTGSFTIARRFIEDGYMPDKDSVRVEEFVNYFDQGYAQPRGDAFAIHLDGGAAPFTESQRYQMLRVGIQGYALPPEARKDAALTFVIDVSGSMDMENRLELVKDSMAYLVEQLREEDSVAIVIYGNEAHTLLEATPASKQQTILRVIRSLEPEGSTNAADGLRLGYAEALKGFKPDGINRVILCSDGVANVGDTSADSIWDSIKARASEGITLTTLGFGMGNYNDVLMEQLADRGDGFYAYIDDLKEAERIFGARLTSTLQVIAMNARVQVDFNPDSVERYRLVGFENRAVDDEDFRREDVDAGEIGAGHSVTALYEVKLYPGAAGRLATIALRWEDPDTHEFSELAQDFRVEQLQPRFTQADPHFQWDVLVAEFAEVLRGSYWAQNSSPDEIYDEVVRVGRLLEGGEDIDDFVDMVSHVVRIDT